VVDAGPLAIAMQVAALCYCNHHLTDGAISRPAARTLLDFDGLSHTNGDEVSADDVIDALVAAGMWHRPDHDCDTCPAVTKGFVIHDYLDQQPSRAEVLAKREQTANAGRKGGKARAAKQNAKRDDKQNASTTPSGTPDTTPSETPGEPQADRQANGQAKSKPVPGPVPVPPEDPVTTDVVTSDLRSDTPPVGFDLVVHDITAEFARLVEGRGARAPTPGTAKHDRWLRAIDLLIRRGSPGDDARPVDPDEVRRVMRWVDGNAFERRVVLSPGKFRERFDQLRISADEDTGKHTATPARDADYAAGWGGKVAQ
jgi:hypothetical protein